MIAIKAAIWLSGVAGPFVLLRNLRPVPLYRSRHHDLSRLAIPPQCHRSRYCERSIEPFITYCVTSIESSLFNLPYFSTNYVFGIPEELVVPGLWRSQYWHFDILVS